MESPRTQPTLGQRPPLPPGFLGLIVVVGVVFLVALASLVYLGTRKPVRPAAPDMGGAAVQVDRPVDPNDPTTPDHFVEGFFIPPFELVNQNEKPVTNAAFKGKITVIDFFFTHCPFICPAMTGRFGVLVSTLKDVPQAQFLSISVDPVHDTPPRLREYAELNAADTSRWQFLTGPRETTWKILEEGLKWGIEERPEQKIKLPTGNEMSNIRHPGWFALVGPDAKVLGIYKYDVEEDQERLVKRVREIAARLAE
jgi:protein SCO1/2